MARKTTALLRGREYELRGPYWFQLDFRGRILGRVTEQYVIDTLDVKSGRMVEIKDQFGTRLQTVA